MRLAWFACVALALGGCLGSAAPAHVRYPPPQAEGLGTSHVPYQGEPKYLAAARPLLPTTSDGKSAANPCASRSQACDQQLRALLAGIDGQILALSTPPTDVQLAALRLELTQLGPLLAPYPDLAAEHEELGDTVAKLPSLSAVDQASARRRMIELSDLLRVQLAAAQ
jgi:hypothetical protein